MSEITKKEEKEENISAEDYENLLDQYQFSAKEIVPGKIVKGKVIKITKTHVLVDIGFKSEGIIPAEDFSENQDFDELRQGDAIEAFLDDLNGVDLETY